MNNKKISFLIIDGQGGKIGRQLSDAIKTATDKIDLTVIGTNSIATSNMLKSGADRAATGENAIIVCSRKADIIAGPIGIIIADSLNGEISPAVAQAVSQSDAKKILIPINKCNNFIVGIDNKLTLSDMISKTIDVSLEIIDDMTK